MSTSGAIYQIDNDPDDNHVLVSRILLDGTLDYVTAVSTQGRGSELRMSDPLFSQNPVVVFDHTLFVVNPGSNSMSLFEISPKDPTQITLRGVVDTHGDYPVSIAANSRHVAVLNSGTRSGFRVFSWSQHGSLTPVWDRSIALYSPQSTPPMGPANTLSQILFSPDHRSILVAAKGLDHDHPGAILIYPWTQNGLAQRPSVNIPATGYLPFTLDPIDSSGLLVTDAADGVITFRYNSVTGQSTASRSHSLPITGAVCWSAYSPITGNYYVIGAESGNVSEIHVDPPTLQPVLVNTYPLGSTSAAADASVAHVNGRDYFYVNTPGHQSISVLELIGPGQVRLLPPLQLPPSGPAVAGLATFTPRSVGSCTIL